MVLYTVILLVLVALIVALFAIALYIVSLVPYFALSPPFVPSNKRLSSLIAEMLDPIPGSVMYELGAGDMRVSLACWRREPAARYIGIEKHFFPRFLAKLHIRRASAGGQVTVREDDLFTTDLRDATHVYCYLFPAPMQRLLNKFEQELAPGTIVVSLDFPMRDKGPERTIDLAPYNLRLGKTLYVYRF
ncbi:MAG: class I SAM-dependent methyltransferase [bacterium]|nr:class I SAM-dependent methyltransferase [bacterium]